MVLCLLLLLLNCAVGHAQATQGSIVGAVKDAKGAVIPGATITLTNLDTGVVRAGHSSGTGDYTYLDVVAGHYSLAVEAHGFEKYEAKNFTLNVRQDLRLDATMGVGAVQQQVEVNGNVLPAIETQSATISGTFSMDMAIDLPINTRASFGGTSPENIVGYLPGMQGGTMQGPQSFFTDTAIDGVTIQFTDGNNGWPSSEAIGEIRADGVQVNAEYGDPGQIVATTKSGTNHLHGSAFWYYQSSAFNAIPYTYPVTLTKPSQIGNTWGGSAGGPLVIPHYNGRGKTFWFGTYEQWSHPAKSTTFSVVPSNLMKSGDFTNYVSPYFPAGSSIVDPNTGANYGTSIPSSAISPIAANILKTFYPSPNIGDPNSYTDNGVANWQGNTDNTANSKQFNVRGDKYFGSNQKFLLWGSFNWKNNGSDSFASWLLPDKVSSTANRALKVDTNWTITPNIINEGSFAFARNESVSNVPFNGQAWTQGAGWVGLQNLWFNGLPDVSFYNITGIGGRLNSPSKSYTYIYADTLLWNKGPHTMKFGYQYQSFESYSTSSFFGDDQYGNYAFASNGSQGLVNKIDFADFLFGVPFSSWYDDVQFDNDGLTAHTYAFAQDEWRISDRLTLNYGVRYELQPGYYDRHGSLGNFNPSTTLSGASVYMKGFNSILSIPYLESANACDPDGIHNTNNATINGAPCMPVLNNDQAGLPIGLRKHPWLRFEPRFGFAFRPFANDNWAVRGGFGIYNASMNSGSYYSLTGTLQAGTSQYANTYGGPGKVGFQWPQIFAGAGNGGCTNCYGTDYFGTANSVNWKDPYTEQWSLGIEHDFGHGYGARVSYIGSESHQLVWAPDENTLPYSSTVSAYNAPITSRLFPNWGTINTRATGADASYHSLQLAANHRLQSGLEFNSEFTFDKSLADNQGAAAGATNGGETGGNRSTTPLSARVDFGNEGTQARYYWNTTALYDLPFGRGKRFGGSMNRAADLIVGGWRLTSIFTWHSGDWITPYIPGNQMDPSGTGSGLSSALAGFTPPGRSQYPDKVIGAGLHQRGGSRLHWLNPGAYACPGDPSWVSGVGMACHTGAGFNADGTPVYTGPGAEHPLPIGRFGNNGVGSVSGPGYVNLNAGLSKRFQIIENLHLRVEGTFTDVLNHTNLADPNSNVTSNTFGYITSSLGARTGQVAARLEF